MIEQTSLEELQKALLTYLDCKHDVHIEGLFSVFAASEAERERSLRKQFQDLIDAIPMELNEVGKNYECTSIGTKKQWIDWIRRYNEILRGAENVFEEAFVGPKDFVAEEQALRNCLKKLLDDFGDLEDYDNDDVIELVNGLKELLKNDSAD